MDLLAQSPSYSLSLEFDLDPGQAIMVFVGCKSSLKEGEELGAGRKLAATGRPLSPL